jgi:hypothetical protein
MFFIDPYETLKALRKAREEVRKQVDQDRKIAKLEADVQALISRVAAQEEANLVEKYGDAAHYVARYRRAVSDNVLHGLTLSERVAQTELLEFIKNGKSKK